MIDILFCNNFHICIWFSIYNTFQWFTITIAYVIYLLDTIKTLIAETSQLQHQPPSFLLTLHALPGNLWHAFEATLHAQLYLAILSIIRTLCSILIKQQNLLLFVCTNRLMLRRQKETRSRVFSTIRRPRL